MRKLFILSLLSSLALSAFAGAERLPSGVVVTHLEVGNGVQPQAHQRVVVHYDGQFQDGRSFDSSIARGQPAEFSLQGVIPCFSQGLQRMRVGGHAILTCPSDTAYGSAGTQGIPPNTQLYFDIQLLGVK